MAPRKRRGRSSGTPAQPTAQSGGSASNSAATSSHSSPPASKSDHGSSPGAPVAEPPISDADPQTKKLAATTPPDLSARNTPKTDVAPPASADPSREPSLSVGPSVADEDVRADGVDKEHPRAEFLLSTFQEAIKQNGDQNDAFTVASVAVHLYNDMINWAISDVAVQFKRSVFLASESNRYLAAIHSSAPDAANPPRTTVGKYGSRLLYSDKNVTVECSNCGTNISASRYAQHVEKCLGRGGRMSSRAASARLRASAERAEKEAAAELDEVPTRRRRNSSADPAEAGSFTGGPYAKRRKMSPVPSGGSGGASQAGSLQHGRAGLPPSGRTRSSPPQ